MVKRYLHPHVTPAELARAPELLEPALVALVESGTGLEINTSGLRHPVAETYPAPWAVARYRELGGRTLTIGSDAHRTAHFAYGLGRGYRVAADVGFEHVFIRRNQERAFVAVPDRYHRAASDRPLAPATRSESGHA